MQSAREIKVILANWKMHKTIEETSRFMADLAPVAEISPFAIWIAPPFTALQCAAEMAKSKMTMGKKICIGAQNISHHNEGAFTGEISARMVVEAGAEFVILGHSERRRLHAETLEQIHGKLQRALDHGLKPVLCVGESKEEHHAGNTLRVLEMQIATACQGIDKARLSNLIVAYEPIWAIGNGSPATLEQIGPVHLFCKSMLADILQIHQPSVFYGGSVTAENSASLLMCPEVDGLLVGGAALQVDFFRSLNRL